MKTVSLVLQTFAACTLIFSCGQGSVDSRNLSKGTAPIELLENEGQSEGGVDFRLAFEKHVRPVLKENCSGCHIHTEKGAHPFAGEDNELAVSAAQRLIGASLASSRFYVKVSDKENPHPTAKIAEKALPSLKSALEAFFSTVNAEGSSTDIFAAPLKVTKALERWPEVNPTGFLIFEAEGMSIEQPSKFQIKPGTYSGDMAVISNIVPGNPVSGLERTYSSNICSDNPPSISQAAHTNAQNAKYFIPFSATIIDPATGIPVLRGTRNGGGPIEMNNFIRILPGNKLPTGNGEDLPDSDYDSQYDPTLDSIVWLDTQLDHFYARIKKQGLSDQFTAEQKTVFDALVGSLDTSFPTAKTEVLKYLQLEMGNKTAGPTNITLVTWDPVAGDTVETINSGDIHRNEPVPLEDVEPEYKNPGWARFTFTVPTTLDFPDESITPESIPFKLYHRAGGSFRLRIQDNETGQFLDVRRNDSCLQINGQNRYQLGPRFTLAPSKTYTMWFGQVDQQTVLDSFMLVVDSELLEDSLTNPNRNPIVLRNKHYGTNGNGAQSKLKVMPFRLFFGSLELEMDDSNDFYSMTLPIFRLNEKYKGSNVYSVGFDFRVNGQVSLTNKNFKLSGVRAANGLVSYGEVMIPKIKAEDELTVRFTELQLTDQPASKPSYAEAPPQESLKCRDPEFFRVNLWPAYYQQKLVLREDYDTWRNSWRGENETPITFGSEMNDFGVTVETFEVTAEHPEIYTCTSCHNEEHPFLELVEEDHLLSCDKILQRANLQNPLQSFSLRGLRGQFNHIPLYTIFNPWNGNDLRKQKLPSGEEIIWGPMNGKAFATNERSEIDSLISTATTDEEITRLYRSLTEPDRLGYEIDPATGVVKRISGTSQAELTDINPLSTLPSVWNLQIGKDDTTDDILRDHNATVDQWVNRSFLEWIKREKEAMNLVK